MIKLPAISAENVRAFHKDVFKRIKELLVKFNDVYWAASKELRKRLVQTVK